MAKLVGILLALAVAGVIASPAVCYSLPRRQRFRFLLPNRGERRAFGERRPLLELVRSA